MTELAQIVGVIEEPDLTPRHVHVVDEPWRDLGKALLILAVAYPLLVLVLGVAA